MLKFDATNFVILTRRMAVITATIDGAVERKTLDESFSAEDIARWCTIWPKFYDLTKKMSLHVAADHCIRVEQSFGPKMTIGEYKVVLNELMNRLEDELGHQLFLQILPDKAPYYGGEKFDPLVTVSFPSSTLDVEDACKCYALGRNTACVFHLMRVMEVGLRALGKSLNDERLDPKRNPSWETILKRCDDELAKSIKDRSEDWKNSPEFFVDASANLRAVKNAWRNPTMHVEINYDEDRALEVLGAVNGFMRHISTKLKE